MSLPNRARAVVFLLESSRKLQDGYLKMSVWVAIILGRMRMSLSSCASNMPGPSTKPFFLEECPW